MVVGELSGLGDPLPSVPFLIGAKDNRIFFRLATITCGSLFVSTEWGDERWGDLNFGDGARLSLRRKPNGFIVVGNSEPEEVLYEVRFDPACRTPPRETVPKR